MQFASLTELLEMGGHGAYVWSAYVITFTVIAYLLISPLRRKRRIQREHRLRLRREQALAEAQSN